MNKLQRAASISAMAWLLMCPAVGDESVTTGNAWVRATVPGQSVAGAYLDITTAAPAALVAVASSVAGKAELHTMSMDGGVMKMRPLAEIELPASRTVSLKPGGNHIMLIDIKRELKVGERVPLKLTVRDSHGASSTLNVDAEVRAVGTAAHQMK